MAIHAWAFLASRVRAPQGQRRRQCQRQRQWWNGESAIPSSQARTNPADIQASDEAKDTTPKEAEGAGEKEQVMTEKEGVSFFHRVRELTPSLGLLRWLRLGATLSTSRLPERGSEW